MQGGWLIRLQPSLDGSAPYLRLNTQTPSWPLSSVAAFITSRPESAANRSAAVVVIRRLWKTRTVSPEAHSTAS
jgi:hypothetical protein